MMSVRSRFSAVVCVMVCAFVVGCSSPADKKTIVRLGYLQNDLHHLPAFVALEKDFFTREGITVEVAGIFRAGPEEMSAFAARELDIGYVGQAPATAAVLNDTADVQFVSQVNLEGSAIVVKEGSMYKELSDLAEKTVAIPGHATMQDFLLRRALATCNISPDRVKLIVLKPPEMIQALALDNIDAFIAWEPYPSQALHKGIGRILIESSAIWKDHPCCVLVARTDFCTSFPDKIEKIKAVHNRACSFITNNREEAVGIGMKYTGMDRKTVLSAMSRIQYVPHIDRDKGGAFIDFLRNLRYIRKESKKRSINDFIFD